MAVYAIADLHLPAQQKPMDVFGEHWKDHFQRITRDWLERVAPGDVVLLPGDLSWAMRLEDALDDLAAIGALPGTKIMLRGNHDYWWSSIGRVRRALPEGMFALQNDSLLLDGRLYAGSRGWTLPGPGFDEDDRRIYIRERLRLEMSLKHARRLDASAPITAMMHYPPLTDEEPGFSDLLEAYGVEDCVYGHLHGPAIYGAVRGERRGVRYHQVSCDGLGFRLYELYSKSES
uniref:Putative metallophosphoesterase n=1 Tax=uncultured bacterium Ad_125_D08 TaxID=1489285 RepID=A0A0B4N0X1_9BACT|nr:putative metallophosphoesterase [uncultured bacterium Ad_125_D08]